MEGIGDATADGLQHAPMVQPPRRGASKENPNMGGMRNGDMTWIELVDYNIS